MLSNDAPMQAIILAGGKGSRLRPFTTVIPKPLVPVDDLPILEIVLRQLQHYGVKNVTIAVNHLAELIMAFFKEGASIGLNIRYSREDTPLGTAGPLALIQDLDPHFLLMNGDLLCTINFRDLMDFHLQEKNDITIALFDKSIKIDLGVIETDSQNRFTKYIEKPTYHFKVSTGIYAIKSKSILGLIKKGEPLDLPTLVTRASEAGLKVGCYTKPFEWLDIGRPDDYALATELFQNNRSKFLPSK